MLVALRDGVTLVESLRVLLLERVAVGLDDADRVSLESYVARADPDPVRDAEIERDVLAVDVPDFESEGLAVVERLSVLDRVDDGELLVLRDAV